MQSGNRCWTERNRRVRRFCDQCCRIDVKRKVDGTVFGSHSLQTHRKSYSEEPQKILFWRLAENSILMDEISENIFNEEHNKLFLGKVQIREDNTWLSIWWRSRIWSEEIQNTNYSSHSARSAREYICVADWRWRNIFIKNAMQEVAEKLKNWEYAAVRKEIIEKTKMWRISYAAWSGITNSESVLLRSWFTEHLWHTYVPHQALITPSSKKPSREVGMPRNTREIKSVSGNVFDCQHARRDPDELHNDSRKLAIIGVSEKRRNWE